MKTRGWKWSVLFFLITGGTAVMGQDAEVPGDNFSLEGALELFKKSESPQEFEKMLNAQDSKVNNLDLNGDGYIDYVRVIDRNEGNVHTFTLQAVISDTEVQDVAVIALEKKANGKAVLQIIGDEDVYGMETIIEPTQDVRVNAGTSTATSVANVWTWPSVQYVYSPSYVVWVSPWSWTVRPVWWYHWHPVAYYRYNSWWQPYRPYYARCYSPRIVYASHIYRPYRTTSVIVHRRHETQITRYRSTHHNDYVRSRSRYNDNDRYSNNGRNDRQREINSDRPTPRMRDNTDEATRTETRNTRSSDRSDERNNNSARERSESRPADRERTTVEQPRNERSRERSTERNTSSQRERTVSNPVAERERSTIQQPRNEQPPHERVSGQNRSNESRMSNPERSGRSSSGHSGSSQSRGRNNRSR